MDLIEFYSQYLERKKHKKLFKKLWNYGKCTFID